MGFPQLINRHKNRYCSTSAYYTMCHSKQILFYFIFCCLTLLDDLISFKLATKTAFFKPGINWQKTVETSGHSKS